MQTMVLLSSYDDVLTLPVEWNFVNSSFWDFVGVLKLWFVIGIC